MAGPSQSRSDNLRAIIDPEFCARESLRLTREEGEFTAKGVNGHDKYKFTFNGSQLKATFNASQLKAVGSPLLLNLQHNAADKWEVFRVTKNGKVLRFSVEESKGRFYVFLAASKNEKKCDFNITGKWDGQSCKIYLGKDSSKIIAKMDKNKIMTVDYNKDYYPNVDCAFIVALVVVLEKFNPDA